MTKAMYPPNVIKAFNGTTGELTLADIANSETGVPAVASALHRIVGLDVIATNTGIDFYNAKGEVALSARFSQEIMDWILDFDEDQPVHPIQLILREINKQWWVQKTFATQTPIMYHPIPESVEVSIVFENSREGFTTWTGAISENGRLDYVEDSAGNFYFTMEELYAHGVRRLYINNKYELDITID